MWGFKWRRETSPNSRIVVQLPLSLLATFNSFNFTAHSSTGLSHSRRSHQFVVAASAGITFQQDVLINPVATAAHDKTADSVSCYLTSIVDNIANGTVSHGLYRGQKESVKVKIVLLKPLQMGANVAKHMHFYIYLQVKHDKLSSDMPAWFFFSVC